MSITNTRYLVVRFVCAEQHLTSRYRYLRLGRKGLSTKRSSTRHWSGQHVIGDSAWIACFQHSRSWPAQTLTGGIPPRLSFPVHNSRLGASLVKIPSTNQTFPVNLCDMHTPNIWSPHRALRSFNLLRGPFLLSHRALDSSLVLSSPSVAPPIC